MKIILNALFFFLVELEKTSQVIECLDSHLGISVAVRMALLNICFSLPPSAASFILHFLFWKKVALPSISNILRSPLQFRLGLHNFTQQIVKAFGMNFYSGTHCLASTVFHHSLPVSVRIFIAVKRHYDHGNSFKGKKLIGWLIFLEV